MIILIKLLYAGAIAVLLVLLVAFGIRMVYGPPAQPVPLHRGPVAAPPEPSQIDASQAEWERYQEKEADYHARVFLIAAVLGVVAVAGGLALSSRIDAIRLGLVGGGLITVLYAIIQAEGDLDDAGSTVVFLFAVVGLVLVIGAGYRWLSAANVTQET